MKRALTAIALIAGLSLAGCSGSEPADGKTEDAKPAAEDTPQATQLDEAQLKKIIESTDVDGKKFKSVDVKEASGSEAVKGIENAEYDPAECKNVALKALNAQESSSGTNLTGMSSDNTVSVALMSLADDNAAEAHMKSTTDLVDKCGDVTTKAQGIEVSMSYSTFDATVAGADETVGLRAELGGAGEAGFNTDAIISRVGNNIVTVSSFAHTGDEAKVSNAAEAFVDAVKNAG